MKTPYLFVRVTVSVLDIVTHKLHTEDQLRQYLAKRGIDWRLPVTWFDDPGSLRRVYMQRHDRQEDIPIHGHTLTPPRNLTSL